MLKNTAIDYVKGTQETAVNIGTMQRQRDALKPDQQYVMQDSGPSWSKGQIFTGAQLQTRYNTNIKEYKTGMTDYNQYNAKQIRTMRNYPAGTTFTKTAEGYNINFPTDTLEKANQSQLDILRRVPGSGQRLYGLASFGYGAAGAAYSGIKGITGFIPGGESIGRYVDTSFAIGTAQAFSGFNQKTFVKNAAKNVVGSYYSPQEYNPMYSKNPYTFAGGLATETTLAAIPGMGMKKIHNVISGAVAYNKIGKMAYTGGQLALGAGMMAPSVYSIGTKAYSGQYEAAGRELTYFGAGWYGVSKGFKLYGEGPISRKTGLTSYETRSMKGYEKYVNKLSIPAEEKIMRIDTQKALSTMIGEQRLYLKKGGQTYVPGNLRINEVASLTDKPMAKEFAEKSLIHYGDNLVQKGSVLAPKEIVDTPGDIDFMANAKQKAIFDYFIESRYSGGDSPWHVHMMQDIGGQTGSGRLGGVRLNDWITPKGEHTISLTEWADRLRVSSSELSSEGRLKDIERLPKVWDYIYKQRGFIKTLDSGETQYDFPSTKLFEAYTTSKKGLAYLHEHPPLMEKELSNYYFGKTIRERLFETKVKLYQKSPFIEKTIKNIVDPTGSLQMQRTTIRPVNMKDFGFDSDTLGFVDVPIKKGQSQGISVLRDVMGDYYDPVIREYYHYPKIYVNEKLVSWARENPTAGSDIEFGYLGSKYSGTRTDILHSLLVHEQTHIQRPSWGEKLVEFYQVKGKHSREMKEWSWGAAEKLSENPYSRLTKLNEPDVPPYMKRGVTGSYMRYMSPSGYFYKSNLFNYNNYADYSQSYKKMSMSASKYSGSRSMYSPSNYSSIGKSISSLSSYNPRKLFSSSPSSGSGYISPPVIIIPKVSPSKSKSYSYYSPNYYSPGYPYYKKPSLYGSGSSTGEQRLFPSQYKFREFKIPEIKL